MSSGTNCIPCIPLGRYIPVRHLFFLILVDIHEDVRNKMNLPNTWPCTHHPPPISVLLRMHQELSITHMAQRKFLTGPVSLTCFWLGCWNFSQPRPCTTVRQCAHCIITGLPCLTLHLCLGCVPSLACPLSLPHGLAPSQDDPLENAIPQ